MLLKHHMTYATQAFPNLIWPVDVEQGLRRVLKGSYKESALATPELVQEVLKQYRITTKMLQT